MSDLKFTKEQLQAIKDEGNILISASAGSGKTTVLVERVLNNIIKRHIPINRMLVLTFTEMASLEMKEKITKTLIEVAKEGGETAKLMKEQIALIPFSQISTIHSFCMEICRGYFDYLGINPTFDILSDMDVELYKLKAFNNVIDELNSNKNDSIDVDLLVGVLTNNRTLDELFTVIKRIQNNIETQVNRNYLADQVRFMFTDEGIKQIEDSVLNEQSKIIEDCFNDLTNLRIEAIENAKYIDLLIDSIEPLRTNATLKQMVSYAEVYTFKQSLKEQASTERPGFVQEVRHIKETVSGVVDTLLTYSPFDEVKEMYLKTQGVLNNLVAFTNEYIKEYTRLKLKDNKFDFNDLEKYAIKVLENDDLANEIASKFDAVFVDEYQDTNYIQEYIVDRVAKNERFYVGDLKQSIYGFRLCEPKIIKDKYDRYKNTDEGEAIDLNCNYRSSLSVINFVNKIFDVIMTEKTSLVDYKGTSRLVKGGENNDEIDGENKDCKIVLIDPIPPEKVEFTGIYDVLKHEIVDHNESIDLETQYIINEINNLVGKVEIDGRKCKYSDIAILVQSRNRFNNMIKRMEKFLPLNLIDFEENLSLQDINIINNILSLSLNIYQDKPLAKALLSYFGKLQEQDLADIRIKYPKDTFYNAVLSYSENEHDEIQEKLVAFLRLLDEIRFTSSFKDTPTLFRNLLNTGFDEYIISLKDGKERLNNINNYIEQLSSNDNLYNIIDYLQYTKSNNIETKTGSSKNRDAVQVMTIHKSKGLEFPIVFIPNLDLNFNEADLKNAFLYNKHIGAGIYYYDSEKYVKKNTIGRMAVSNYIKKELRMEKIRLFYVALTRAKNKLYLTAIDKVKAAASIPSAINYLSMIKYAIEKDSSLEKYIEHHNDLELPKKEIEKYEAKAPSKEYQKIVEDTINFKYPHEEATTMLIDYSATSINKNEDIDQYKIFEDSKSAMVGTIYHRVMEHIDFNCYTLDEVKQEINKMIESNILTVEEADIVKPEEIFRVLQLDIMNIASRNNCLREKQFLIKANAKDLGIGTQNEDIMIKGIMDLLILGDEDYLIDYKYSNSSDEELIKTYKKQFYVYETAYKTLFKSKNLKKVLVNLKKGTEIHLN